MAESKAEDSKDPSLNQLIDMFIYAPIGMLYEYPDVLPQLIKKGKSQVSLAKVMGELALRKTMNSSENLGAETIAGAGGAIAKLINELGDILNFGDLFNAAGPDSAGGNSNGSNDVIEVAAIKSATPKSDQRLPIAGYDDLTAREIIGLLGDISPAQRARIRAHEKANRARKTVLAKLDQLGD